jgi:hypothetical protein
VLQLLLTNGVEYDRTLPKSKQHKWLQPVDKVLMSVVEEYDAVVDNTFPEALDAFGVLTHLRNAVGHPRMKIGDPPTTGYSTESDSRGEISHVTLTDSPDCNSKGRARRPEHRPKWKGRPYEGPARIFTLRLAVAQLCGLTRTLALRLSNAVAPVIQGEFPIDKADTLIERLRAS